MSSSIPSTGSQNLGSSPKTTDGVSPKMRSSQDVLKLLGNQKNPQNPSSLSPSGNMKTTIQSPLLAEKNCENRLTTEAVKYVCTIDTELTICLKISLKLILDFCYIFNNNKESIMYFGVKLQPKNTRTGKKKLF